VPQSVSMEGVEVRYASVAGSHCCCRSDNSIVHQRAYHRYQPLRGQPVRHLSYANLLKIPSSQLDCLITPVPAQVRGITPHVRGYLWPICAQQRGEVSTLHHSCGRLASGHLQSSGGRNHVLQGIPVSRSRRCFFLSSFCTWLFVGALTVFVTGCNSLSIKSFVTFPC
jgi:hypothetical protein